MSDLPKSITIDGETITPDMVRNASVTQEPLVGRARNQPPFLHTMLHRVTLHLRDGRVLKTEVYN